QMEYSYITFAILGMVLSIVSQIGDFIASIIKRFVDTKDYGNLLPGHGGMLDRIDSLLFIAPFAYMIFYYLV
ncbi:MAG: phosphatidate cytidylyltransferase, partial [Clostridia bacterium]|nr:phosphatidate cytidylyltransferase [Clostridia bacterium]